MCNVEAILSRNHKQFLAQTMYLRLMDIDAGETTLSRMFLAPLSFLMYSKSKKGA